MEKPNPGGFAAFGLSSEQCELLLAFEAAGTVTELSRWASRDISVISRQLQRIAEMAPVLEKNQGKWRLSELGRALNLWTREASAAQKRLLKRQQVLRIAATREFAARVLAPQLKDFLDGEGETEIAVLTSERGVEHLLLKGKADIGFDCGRPQDPSLRFRTALAESFVVVGAPSLLGGCPVAREELLGLPHLQYKRASASRLLRLPTPVPHVLATFDDIASIREAACAGAGWAVLPWYAVRRELETGALVVIPGWDIEPEHFGVWWVRGRRSVEPWVERAVSWLRAQRLS